MNLIFYDIIFSIFTTVDLAFIKTKTAVIIMAIEFLAITIIIILINFIQIFINFII